MTIIVLNLRSEFEQGDQVNRCTTLRKVSDCPETKDSKKYLGQSLKYHSRNPVMYSSLNIYMLLLALF